MHSCHWPMVNDTNALSVIYTQQSAFVSLTNVHSCHWPTCIRVIDHSLRRDDCPCLERPHHAFVSLTSGQWHECTECDLHPASASVSLTNVHSCHWPFPKEGWFSLSRDASSCIRVIDHWSMTRMHRVYFTPSICIRVIDQCAFVSLTIPYGGMIVPVSWRPNMFLWHWPLSFESHAVQCASISLIVTKQGWLCQCQNFCHL